MDNSAKANVENAMLNKMIFLDFVKLVVKRKKKNKMD
jgi:hypothetical protein